MEAMLGLFLSQTNTNAVFLISYVFSSTNWENKREEQVLPRSGGWRGVGEVEAQTMYTRVSKCKNNKMFFKSQLKPQ
jgi:hypothetical protein